MYLNVIRRPRISHPGVVENPDDEPVCELTYEEFLRQLIESRSDKSDFWRENLRRINPQNEPLVESPAETSLPASNSQSSGAVDSVGNDADMELHSSAVHIVEIKEVSEMQIDEEAPNTQPSEDGVHTGSPARISVPVVRTSNRI